MAGRLQFVGDSRLTFGPIKISSTPKGSTSHFTVTCPLIGALVNYHNYIVQFGATVEAFGFDTGNDGATGAEERRLEVSVPGLVNNLGNVISELFFDCWEFLSNEGEDTIFSNPLIVGGSSPVLNYNDKVVLSRLARNGGTIADAVQSCNDDITNGNLLEPTVGYGPLGGGVSSGGSVIFQKPGTLSPPDSYGGTAPGQLALEIAKGQTGYEKPTYVLRHTSYCSAGALYNANIANTQKIYTPARLLTEVGSGWTYNLPPRLYSKIAGIPFESAPVHESPYYTWGWLKKITREPVLANFMVEVSTEYELGLWSNLRYGIA